MGDNHSDLAERISHREVTDNRHSGNAGVRTLGVSAHPCLQLPECGAIQVNHLPPLVIDGAAKGEQGVDGSGGNPPLLHPAQGVMAIHGTPPPSFCALHRWHLRYRLLMFLERRARCNQQGHRLVSDWFRSVLQQKERPIAP